MADPRPLSATAQVLPTNEPMSPSLSYDGGPSSGDRFIPAPASAVSSEPQQHLQQQQGQRGQASESSSIGHGPDASFQPLFTVIEDATTREQHHPHVRYVFSDDDPEVLTTGVLAALQSASRRDPLSETGLVPEAMDGEATDAVEERHVLLDLGPRGLGVVAAHSLSPDWQVLRCEVKPAPTFGMGSGESGTMMLTVTGMAAAMPPAEGVAEDDDLTFDLEEGGDVEAAIRQLELLAVRCDREIETLKTLMSGHVAPNDARAITASARGDAREDAGDVPDAALG